MHKNLSKHTLGETWYDRGRGKMTADQRTMAFYDGDAAAYAAYSSDKAERGWLERSPYKVRDRVPDETRWDQLCRDWEESADASRRS